MWLESWVGCLIETVGVRAVICKYVHACAFGSRMYDVCVCECRRSHPGYRVKSRTMATYTTDDIKTLQEGGNEAGGCGLGIV